MTDALGTIKACHGCRQHAEHVQALRSLVRPARRAGEAMQGVLGAYFMASDDTELVSELLLLPSQIEVLIAKIVKTAGK